MATRALDVVTIMHALARVQEELDTENWIPQDERQMQLITWLNKHRKQLLELTGISAKASRFWEELNDFLMKHGFDPMLDEFDPEESLGVVSILDKLVQWLQGPGELVDIQTENGPKPGFEIPPEGVNVYRVDSFSGSHLLELKTKSDDTLWIFVHDDTTLEGLAMTELSMFVMNRNREVPTRISTQGRGLYNAYEGAQVPMVDFDIQPDISWIMGARTIAGNGDAYFISQAKQQFKMRIDETGARVKVATAIGVTRESVAILERPEVFVVRQPFYGWWTQKGLEYLPMATFFVDWDAMKKPEGSLEDL